MERMKGDEFSAALVRGSNTRKANYSTMFPKDFNAVVWKQIGLCEKHEIIARPERGSLLSRGAFPRMTMKYARTCYEEVRKDVIGSRNGSKVWAENTYGNVEGCVGFIQFHSDKSATMLSGTSLVVNHMYDTFLNISTKRRQWLINNVHTLVRLLPVCCTQ